MNGNPHLTPVPFWKIWANPIFRRYCRSRLRPRTLFFSLLLTILIAGFIFFIGITSMEYRAEQSPSEAARGPIIALLIFQGIILFLLGTGQTAGGMTAEADEGVLDYQRLTPMTPLTKVVGYLFGLPVREYVCCLATLPFTVWCIWKGEVELPVALSLYAVFFSSAVLYHSTGLVAGTVIRNRRWAFLTSMAMVFILYTVLPQVAKFGLSYFRYLTIGPVFTESLSYLLPRDAGAVVKTGQAILGNARFFDIDLPEFVFTLISQAIVVATLLHMAWRRWKRAESHLLGKAWALALYVWIQITILGIALPRIDSGEVFPAKEASTFFSFSRASLRKWKPEPYETIIVGGTAGIVSLVILWSIICMITPNAETQLRGWRRVHKLGQKRLNLFSDPATGSGWVAAMAIIGAGGWYMFVRAIVDSRWFPGMDLPSYAPYTLAMVFLTAGLGFHALLEGKGTKAVALCAVLIGVFPLMVAAVVGMISDKLATPSIWIGSVSPVVSPLSAMVSLLDVGNVPVAIARVLPNAFAFTQGVGFLVTLWLIMQLMKSRKEIAAKAAEIEKS